MSKSPTANPRLTRSTHLFSEAASLFPGGVNSPVRAFRSVGGTPPFIASAQGSQLYDVDGNQYIDYVQSWGTMILGHAHPNVVSAISRAAQQGTSYGAPTEAENVLGQIIIDAVPSVEMLRFVNSGTEAVMSALRLARAATGRRLIIKFMGGYHGHSDSMLVQAGSGAAVDQLPASPGVSQAAISETLLAPYNDIATVQQLFTKYEQQIAAVIVEPVAGNMGAVPPSPDFLAGLRELTQRHGALLIFDEVITGFRVGWHGAQGLYGVPPDITCLGKIIGGGLPVGAYSGSRQLMELVSPSGPVYQAGTLSGNPLAMAAGVATLRTVAELGISKVYQQLEEHAQALVEGLRTAAASAQVPFSVTQVGSMIGLFFRPEPPTYFTELSKSEKRSYAKFFHGMLSRGIYLPPALYESLFISLAHTADDIAYTVDAAKDVFAEL